jgi:hypothetical protein
MDCLWWIDEAVLLLHLKLLRSFTGLSKKAIVAGVPSFAKQRVNRFGL